MLDGRNTLVAGEVDIVAKQQLQRRIAQRITIRGVQSRVLNRDSRAVGNDKIGIGLLIFEAHAARFLQIEISLLLPAVAADLKEPSLNTFDCVERGRDALQIGLFGIREMWRD